MSSVLTNLIPGWVSSTKPQQPTTPPVPSLLPVPNLLDVGGCEFLSQVQPKPAADVPEGQVPGSGVGSINRPSGSSSVNLDSSIPKPQENPAYQHAINYERPFMGSDGKPDNALAWSFIEKVIITIAQESNPLMYGFEKVIDYFKQYPDGHVVMAYGPHTFQTLDYAAFLAAVARELDRLPNACIAKPMLHALYNPATAEELRVHNVSGKVLRGLFKAAGRITTLIPGGFDEANTQTGYALNDPKHPKYLTSALAQGGLSKQVLLSILEQRQQGKKDVAPIMIMPVVSPFADNVMDISSDWPGLIPGLNLPLYKTFDWLWAGFAGTERTQAPTMAFAGFGMVVHGPSFDGLVVPEAIKTTLKTGGDRRKLPFKLQDLRPSEMARICEAYPPVKVKGIKNPGLKYALSIIHAVRNAYSGLSLDLGGNKKLHSIYSAVLAQANDPELADPEEQRLARKHAEKINDLVVSASAVHINQKAYDEEHLDKHLPKTEATGRKLLADTKGFSTTIQDKTSDLSEGIRAAELELEKVEERLRQGYASLLDVCESSLDLMSKADETSAGYRELIEQVTGGHHDAKLVLTCAQRNFQGFPGEVHGYVRMYKSEPEKPEMRLALKAAFETYMGQLDARDVAELALTHAVKAAERRYINEHKTAFSDPNLEFPFFKPELGKLEGAERAAEYAKQLDACLGDGARFVNHKFNVSAQANGKVSGWLTRIGGYELERIGSTLLSAAPAGFVVSSENEIPLEQIIRQAKTAGTEHLRSTVAAPKMAVIAEQAALALKQQQMLERLETEKKARSELVETFGSTIATGPNVLQGGLLVAGSAALGVSPEIVFTAAAVHSLGIDLAMASKVRWGTGMHAMLSAASASGALSMAAEAATDYLSQTVDLAGHLLTGAGAAQAGVLYAGAKLLQVAGESHMAKAQERANRSFNQMNKSTESR